MLKLLWAHSLFARVFVHGVVVLLATAATFAALGAMFLRPALDRDLLELGSWIAPRVCSHITKSDGHRERRSALIATVYSADGVLQGSLVTPPVPPLSAADVARLRVEKAIPVPGRNPLHAYWCTDTPGDTYVELAPRRPMPPSGFLLPFLLVVVVVAFASVPFARSIARPIAELVRVTQAFGRGELTARTDIARRDEVGELALAFNQMADRLQHLISAEQELLADVSHELRTPLARIRVVLETAREKPRLAQSLLQEIGNDLGDLERLVETVMATMRLDMEAAALSAGQLPARLEPTDVVATVRRAVRRFREMYPDRAVELELEGESLPADADPRLLWHLFDNLLDNARKYSDTTSSILVRASAESGQRELVRIEVVDQGIGIAPEELPQVFVPFFRGDRSRSRAPSGAGLGLALAKRIVDAHAGQIVVSSELGVGTRIHVTLARSHSPKLEPPTEELSAAPARASSSEIY